MTTLTAYSGTGDGYITSASATYSAARSGTGTAANTTGTELIVANHLSGGTYTCAEGFIAFDTSSIDDSATVSAATLTVTLKTDLSTTDFTLEARTHSWGTLTTADWVAGADLGSLTLLASRSSSTMTVVNTAYALTSEAAFIDAINKTGSTEIILNNSRHRNGDVPTGLETQFYYSANESGTSRDPTLVVEYGADTPRRGVHYRSQAPDRASRF